jgi:large subunit ribosomal protein L17
MKHQKKGRGLSLPADRRVALIRNMMRSLVLHQSITTTEAKAKEVQRHVESLVTVARPGTVHARRVAMASLPDASVIDILVREIAPKFADRPGGYTRLTRVGSRQGDGAQMARLEFVLGEA